MFGVVAADRTTRITAAPGHRRCSMPVRLRSTRRSGSGTFRSPTRCSLQTCPLSRYTSAPSRSSTGRASREWRLTPARPDHSGTSRTGAGRVPSDQIRRARSKATNRRCLRTSESTDPRMLKSLPPSDCARAREAASARLDGELSELEEAHLLRHLRFCAECRAHTREVAELAHRLRSAPLEMPTETLFVDRPSSRLRARSVTVAVALVLAAALSFGTGGLFCSQGPSSGGA